MPISLKYGVLIFYQVDCIAEEERVGGCDKLRYVLRTAVEKLDHGIRNTLPRLFQRQRGRVYSKDLSLQAEILHFSQDQSRDCTGAATKIDDAPLYVRIQPLEEIQSGIYKVRVGFTIEVMSSKRLKGVI